VLEKGVLKCCRFCCLPCHTALRLCAGTQHLGTISSTSTCLAVNTPLNPAPQVTSAPTLSTSMYCAGVRVGLEGTFQLMYRALSCASLSENTQNLHSRPHASGAELLAPWYYAALPGVEGTVQRSSHMSAADTQTVPSQERPVDELHVSS
jgi:hypothetical protein